MAALLAAPPVISLIQSGFQIELNWGFWHAVQYYRSVFSPLLDAVQTPARLLIEWLHLSWLIPQWVKDLHALSFVAAALYVRGWGHPDEMEWRAVAAAARKAGNSEPRRREKGVLVWLKRITRQAVLGVILGITGASFLAWLIALATFVRSVFYRGSLGEIRASYRTLSLLKVTAATMVAASVFYASNAIAPQLIAQ